MCITDIRNTVTIYLPQFFEYMDFMGGKNITFIIFIGKSNLKAEY